VLRWRNILRQSFFYRLCRRYPEAARALLRRGVVNALGPDYDVDTHFKPAYDPWDQRLCLAPDGDLFAAIRSGRVEVVTDHVASFTEGGVKLRSGAELSADLIVTATGLDLLFLGGIELVVDGYVVEPSGRMVYRGMMLSGVPNCAFTVGYTNASWTLKADLTSEYVCRLLAYMDAHGAPISVPQITDQTISEKPLLNLNSGYILRAVERFPKQGSREPWRLPQSYLRDLWTIRRGRIEDGSMQLLATRTQSKAAYPFQAVGG
jgi:cation diffusion facilitator CzcD-associated flavoprotein CzcO